MISIHWMTRSRSLWLIAALSSATFGALFTACTDEETPSIPVPDSGTGTDAGQGTDAQSTDGSTDDAGDPAVIARGKYLVDHVSVCGDCHTPRLPSGAPDTSKYLSGAECFVDVNGRGVAGGCLHSANLTNDPTGLKNRTAAQIKTMFQDGKRPDGKFLVPVMPYFTLHNMKAEDADAIVAYLRTVTGVAHQVPANDPPFDNVPAAATPVDPASIPTTDGGAAAERGRYLAAMAGPCLECHTTPTAPGSAAAIEMTKAFAGGREFKAANFGLPTPAYPPSIYTSNLTSHASGLAGWTAADVVRVIKQGHDRTDGGVCPPMPVGPMGAFGGLTDGDALDIATYIVGLPPIDNTVPNGCVVP
jgi:mono/diheme cytochrome c family protein